MSIPMTMLALLDERPHYGLELKQEFDRRTGAIWPLNVGQVYTTLRRLERDGLVAEADGPEDSNRTYRITEEGHRQVEAWFERPDREATPARDELVLKLILAAGRGRGRLRDVIQSERRAAVEALQAYTRLLHEPAEDADLGWLLLLDSLIFKAEARVRWLDNAEGRMAAHRPSITSDDPVAATATETAAPATEPAPAPTPAPAAEG